MSATSETDIFNWALSIAGLRESISHPEDEGRPAEVCRLWYSGIRDDVLRASPWPSARKVQRLALLKTKEEGPWQNGDPHPGYRFAYSYPNDMIRPRYLADFSPFITGLLDDSRQAIMTNTNDAVLTYTMRQTRVGAWESDLQMAIAHGLAAYICGPLSGQIERIDYALQLANNKIMEARLNAANQDMQRYDSTPEWFTARGYGDNAERTRFIFPLGDLLAPPAGWKSFK